MKFLLGKKTKTIDVNKKDHDKDDINGTAFHFNEDPVVTLTPPNANKPTKRIIAVNIHATSVSDKKPPESRRNLKPTSMNETNEKLPSAIAKSRSCTNLEPSGKGLFGRRRLSSSNNSATSTDDLRKPRSKSLKTPQHSHEDLSTSPRVKVRSVSFVAKNGTTFTPLPERKIEE